jgi:hypothetical protein
MDKPVHSNILTLIISPSKISLLFKKFQGRTRDRKFIRSDQVFFPNGINGVLNGLHDSCSRKPAILQIIGRYANNEHS